MSKNIDELKKTFGPYSKVNFLTVLRRINNCYKEEKYDDIFELYDLLFEIPEKDPKMTKAFDEGVQLYQNQKYKEAISKFKEYIRYNKGLMSQNMFSAVLNQNNRIDLYLQEFSLNRPIIITPIRIYEAYYLQAMCYLSLKNDLHAEDCFYEATVYNPIAPGPYFNLALLYLDDDEVFFNNLNFGYSMTYLPEDFVMYYLTLSQYYADHKEYKIAKSLVMYTALFVRNDNLIASKLAFLNELSGNNELPSAQETDELFKKYKINRSIDKNILNFLNNIMPSIPESEDKANLVKALETYSRLDFPENDNMEIVQ